MSQHNLFDDDDDGMLVHPIVNNRSSSTVPQVVLQSIETSIGPNQLRVKKETLSLFEEDEEGIDELVALRLTASASSGRLNKAIIPDSLFDGEDDIHGNDSNTKSNNNLQFDLSSTKISQVAQLRGSLFDDEEEVVSLARGGGSGPTVAPKIPHTTGVVSASKNLFADDDEESVFESKYYEERARRIQLESKVAELQSKLALLENKLFKYEPDFDWKGLQVPSSSIQSPSMSSRKSVRLSVRGVRDIFAGSSPVQDAAVARPGPSDNTTDEGGEGVNNNSPSAVENDECGTEGVDISGGGGGGSSQGVSEAAMRRQRRYAATVGAKTARRRNLRTASTRTTPSNIVDSSSSNNEEALEDESPVAESATYAHTEGGGSADRNSVSLESYSDAEQTENATVDEMDPEVMAQCLVQAWARGKDIVGMLRTFGDIYLDTEKLPEELLFPTINSASDVRKNYLKIVRYCHPDKQSKTGDMRYVAPQLFSALSDAYDAFRSSVGV